MRPLLESYFREDPECLWTAAPKPRLTDDSFERNYFYEFENVWTDEEKRERLGAWRFRLTEEEPLWSGADAMRCGRDVFWQGSSTTNRCGMDWLRRYFGARGIRVHCVRFWGDLHPWHIDSVFVPLRPGLAMYCPDKPPITDDVFALLRKNDWELVPAARPTHVHWNKVRMYEEYGVPYWTSMNTLSLDDKTICVEAHETGYMQQLDKLGFEVVPIAYDAVIPFGGALHCTTLDVHRDGACEDYFPNQIAGF